MLSFQKVCFVEYGPGDYYLLFQVVLGDGSEPIIFY